MLWFVCTALVNHPLPSFRDPQALYTRSRRLTPYFVGGEPSRLSLDDTNLLSAGCKYFPFVSLTGLSTDTSHPGLSGTLDLTSHVPPSFVVTSLLVPDLSGSVREPKPHHRSLLIPHPLWRSSESILRPYLPRLGVRIGLYLHNIRSSPCTQVVLENSDGNNSSVGQSLTVSRVLL